MPAGVALLWNALTHLSLTWLPIASCVLEFIATRKNYVTYWVEIIPRSFKLEGQRQVTKTVRFSKTDLI